MAQHFQEWQAYPDDPINAGPPTKEKLATQAQIREFAELTCTKLNEDSYRHEGPLEDVAEMVLKEARNFFPKDVVRQLERPAIDQDILQAAKDLNKMSELLIPPQPKEERKASMKLWSVLLNARTMNTDIAEDLLAHWQDELDYDQDVVECWTKDGYAPEKIRDDIVELFDESIFDVDRGKLINQELMKASTELATYMLKEWKPEHVNEFISKNPPTYEDGIKAAKKFIRFKQGLEARNEMPSLA